MDIDREQVVRAFRDESREQLTLMEEALLGLEQRPDDAEAVQTAFRVVHTMKGSASSLGYPDLAAYAHEVEEQLDGLRSGQLTASTEVVSRFLRVVDLLRSLVPAVIAGEPADLGEARAVLAQLAQMRRRDTDGRRDAPAPGAPGAGRRLEDRQRTLRVDIAKLDRLLNLTGEIAVLRGRARQLAAGSRTSVEAQEVNHELDTLFHSLQEEVLRARMVAVEWILRPHIRTVRDAAEASRKLARLIIEGGDVEVDTSIIEHLRDPITHMVRNAVDHGIEMPKVRKKQGKDPCGSVTLRAVHEGSGILIRVEDDGAGLRAEKIAQRARERALHPSPEDLSPEDLFQLIFAPGFSTSDEVTDLSGRGVGMDVVRRNVEMLRGTVSLESRPGRGTAVNVRVPLTLATIPGFGVGVAGETYVIPLDCVIECVDFPRRSAGRSAATGVFSLRDKPVPFVRLRDQFQFERERPAREKVIVVEHHGRRMGLVIDELFGETQTVVRPLGRLFRGISGFSGSAVLGDGSVALILDVPGLLEATILPQGGSAGPAPRPAA